MSQTEILEALQSDEGKRVLADMVAEGVAAGIAEALPTALEEREQTIRESVREELGQTNRLRSLHSEARRVIEAATLPKTAKDKLLADYGIEENDDDTVTPGPSLTLIEAVKDDQGQVTKPAKEVLTERVEGDIASYRNVIREAAPTVPRAAVNGGSAGSATASSFGSQGSAWADRVRKRGLDPSSFGAQKPATTAAAE